MTNPSLLTVHLTGAQVSRARLSALRFRERQWVLGKLAHERLERAGPAIGNQAAGELHRRVAKLPKGVPGKLGSPQRGTSTKGYRLDPPHPNAKPGTPE